MSKARFLILLLVLLGAAGAFLATTGDSTADLGIDVSEPWFEDGPDVDEAVEMNPVAPVDDEPEWPDGKAPVELAGINREEVAGVQGAARDLVVQVWDGKRGVPAAAADVFFVDGAVGPQLPDPFAQHWSDLAEARGQGFKTDLAGRVTLPAVQKSAFVSARRGGAYGFARVGRKHRKIETITLQPDETLTVRVVDGRGHPAAGVPVGVVQRVPVRQRNSKVRIQQLRDRMNALEVQMKRVERSTQANPRQRQQLAPRLGVLRDRHRQVTMALRKQYENRKKNGKKQKRNKKKRSSARKKPQEASITERLEMRARRRSDSGGVAVFKHFQIYRRKQQGWWPADYHHQFQAVLLMPLQQPVTQVFRGRPVPTETIELTLPPAGSIALRMVDHDGRPFTHPVRVDLRPHDFKTVAWARLSERKEQNAEAVEFPLVGLGLRFTASARLDDDDFRWNVKPFVGPRNPGERVTIDVVVAPEAGMLFGRLLDGAGKPLAGVRPTFLINTRAGRLEGEDITLDTSGRFHLPYAGSNRHVSPFRLEIRRPGVRPLAGLAMGLPLLPPGRVTDLGDLRIDALGKVARGTVVDDRGRPVKRATVQLQRERVVGGKKQRVEFRDEAFTVARTDADGRYELFGELEPGRYRLSVHAPNHFSLDSPTLQPNAQTDLQLQRIAKVVGTVLTPSWLPSRSVQVRLELARDPRQRRDDRVRDYKGKSFVYFDRVRPGIYNLIVSVRGFPDPIVRFDGLEILPGQLGQHQRLQNIDLGAFVYRFEIFAVDDGARPFKPSAPLLAKIVRPGGQTEFVGFPWRGNRVEIFSVSPQLELWPLATGYQAEQTVLGHGRSELRFQKTPAVDLQVPGLRALAGKARVWVSMVLIDNPVPVKLEVRDQRSGRRRSYGRRQMSKSAGRMLGKGDSVRVRPMRDGRYQVVAYMNQAGSGWVQVQLGVVDIRLPPGAGSVRVVVRVDAERVKAGLAEMARRRQSKRGKR